MTNKGEYKRRIGIYGGAFDPPHFGHMWVVSCILNSGEVDQIWLVPSGTRQDKKTVAPGWARAEMLQQILNICFDLDERLQVCSVEIEDSSPIRGTVELIDELKNRFSDLEFKIIIGADLVPQLPSWRNQKQLKEFQFLVVGRPGTFTDSPEGFKVKQIQTPILLEISAHQLRDLIADQKEVAGLLPHQVEEMARAYYLHTK